MTADTFERSCAHWSEGGRAEMERFYEIASVDYRHLAEARDWRAWLASKSETVGERPLRVLDVACGSGKFPQALARYGGITGLAVPKIEYALLDPSRFSIDEARAALAPPFEPSTEFETTLQDLNCRDGAFDVVWATHALYAIPKAELKAGLRRLVDACSGEAFIAHACADAHYIKFQRLYLAAFDRKAETPYTAAEDIASALKAIGVDFEATDIVYENGAPETERTVIEGYLQRCVFDDAASLDDMESSDILRAYLDSCKRDGAWRFAQRVALFSIYP
ncbi:MAG: class I SAM-dependent methyltransferase [Pseudomonadota bacterium]